MQNGWWRFRASLAAGVFVVAAGAGAACSGSDDAGQQVVPTLGDAGRVVDAAKPPPRDAARLPSETGTLGDHSLKSIGITPLSPTIQSVARAKVKQAFAAHADYADGSQKSVTTDVTWSADQLDVGRVDQGGLFTATGALGGVVKVTASYQGLVASATLTVSLLLKQNPAGVPKSVQTALTTATTPDPSVVWAYPYDGTVWPRGLLPPILQWNGGASTDDYCVDIKSSTFELHLFSAAMGAPASQLPLDAATWGALTGSTSGAAKVKVTRWDGTAATVIANDTWTIASGSMRGTIYYWSNDLGRVLRIQPGASTADDFANQSPLTDPAQYQQDSCLMTCHTVSADGSTLVSGGGVFAGSYDLETDQPIHSLGGTWGVDPNTAGQPEWQNIEWETPAVSPTGKYVLVNSMAQSGVTSLGGPGTLMALFTTADGLPVARSGVTGTPFAAPAWSPDGTRVVFVGSGDPSTWTAAGQNWQNPAPGDLEVIEFDESKSPMFSGQKKLVALGTGSPITWPSVSPDGNWVIYSRAGSFDTRNGNGDLYLASAVKPDTEVRLAALDGDGYPFAAGSRDLSWNYEPSFAPVAAGGYFWVVFTSRRTYGDILTAASTGVKQLWVAAIDQNPKPGADPSHAPFHLTGQNESNLAMRGFWSLPPCHGEGASCVTGTDCCGGDCVSAGGAAGDAGAGGADGGEGGATSGRVGVCRATTTGCASDGNKCSKTADCCEAKDGVTCINHVCSEPPPR